MWEWVVVCLCVPWDGLAACPGCPLPSPYVSWDRLQHPRDPNEDEAVLIMDGWMELSSVNLVRISDLPALTFDSLPASFLELFASRTDLSVLTLPVLGKSNHICYPCLRVLLLGSSLLHIYILVLLMEHSVGCAAVWLCLKAVFSLRWTCDSRWATQEQQTLKGNGLWGCHGNESVMIQTDARTLT